MTPNAVLDVGDTFLSVLGNDLCRLVLMASIAGIALVIAAWMACRTTGVVLTIEAEIAVMDEAGRFPVRRLVAGAAGLVLSAMQIVVRGRVAGLAA